MNDVFRGFIGHFGLGLKWGRRVDSKTLFAPIGKDGGQDWIRIDHKNA